MKILWFDCETSGLNEVKNDIITMAFIAEIHGKVQGELSLTCKPFSFDNVSPKALEVNGISMEELETYPAPQEAFKKMLRFFDGYINKFDKGDKFYLAGYNTGFDQKFLKEFFKKNDHKYMYSYMSPKIFDVMQIALYMDLFLHFDFNDHKLGTVGEQLGIELDAHDAMNDIRATRELVKGFNGRWSV